MYFDPTFWLLISFIVLIIFGFKKIKTLAKDGILKYQNNVIHKIETAEQDRAKSDINLKHLQEKISEIENLCKSIKHNAVLESERIENEMKAKLSSYLSFKEKYIQEKIQIQNRLKITEAKRKVLNGAIEIVIKYISKTQGSQKIDHKQIAEIISKKF